MITINDKLVAFGATILIPDGEEVAISQLFPTWPVTFKILFKPVEGNEQPSWTFAPEGTDVLVMIFKGWNSPLGLSLVKPVRIATLNDGRNVGVMVCHYKLGNVNKLDFQVLFGGVYG